MEYRRRFADITSNLLKDYFSSDESFDELYIADYVQRALSTKETGYVNFIWMNFMTEDYLEMACIFLFITAWDLMYYFQNSRRGILRHPILIKTLAHYLRTIEDAVETEPPMEEIYSPIGGVGLACCTMSY